MASRRPLIVNSSAGQIQELTDSDDLSLPNSNVTAQSFIGGGTIPVGGIIMWSGTIAEIANLSGWELCDGNNGTPDLRDRFVIGATTDGSDNTFPGLSVDQSGGSADAVVVEHNHSITQTDHSHGYKETSENNQNRDPGDAVVNQGADAGASTGGAQANITIDNAGVSGTNQNLPPYYALAFIMRTA